MEKEFKIVWYKEESEHPPVGNYCPKCQSGKVYLSKFANEKTGKKTDYYCSDKECGWKWKKSTWGDKQEAPTPSGSKTSSQVILERMDKMEAGLKVSINEILVKLNEWEKQDKVVIYPNDTPKV